MKKTLIAMLAASVALLPGLAAAEYPEKPVEFVVPWPPGDAEDVLTRMIAEDFQEKYGVAAAVAARSPARSRSRKPPPTATPSAPSSSPFP